MPQTHIPKRERGGGEHTHANNYYYVIPKPILSSRKCNNIIHSNAFTKSETTKHTENLSSLPHVQLNQISVRTHTANIEMSYHCYGTMQLSVRKYLWPQCEMEWQLNNRFRGICVQMSRPSVYGLLRSYFKANLHFQGNAFHMCACMCDDTRELCPIAHSISIVCLMKNVSRAIRIPYIGTSQIRFGSGRRNNQK